MIEIGWFKMEAGAFWACGAMLVGFLLVKVASVINDGIEGQKRHAEFVKMRSDFLDDKIGARNPWDTPLLHALGMGSKRSVLEELGVHPGEHDDNVDAFAHALGMEPHQLVEKTEFLEPVPFSAGDILRFENGEYYRVSPIRTTMSTCAYPGPAEIPVQYPMPTPYVAPKNAWQGNCQSCGHRYTYADNQCIHCGAQLPA